MKRWLPIFVAAPLVLLSYFALRLAYADFLFRSGVPENVARAASLFPSNPEYQARTGNLARSLELNPYQSGGWIEQAVDKETRGDWAGAEQDLLRASEVDATFEPRWALANYYFRRDQREEFWKWMRLAAERSYGDRAALFQLAWRSGSPAFEIQSRLADGQPEVLGKYIQWLGRQEKWEEAGVASLSLLRTGQRGEAAAASVVCEHLLQQGKTAPAMEVWNGLAGKGWISGAPVRPDAPLSNARLEWKPAGTGFDWRMPWLPGLEHRWRPGELTIVLTGKEQDQTPLLEQVVPVQSGISYQFRYRYRAEGLPVKSGVRWKAEGMQSDPLANGGWREGTLRFSAPAGRTQVKLILSYERQPGTMRAEATVILAGDMALGAQNLHAAR
ncbi:MAG: hypothetical protein QM757_21390 [Paludibaculum sp.]